MSKETVQDPAREKFERDLLRVKNAELKRRQTVIEDTRRTPVDLPDVVQEFERLAREAAERRRELERWAAKQPKTRKCGEHGTICGQDMDASSRASQAAGKYTLEYEPCGKCLRDANTEWLKRAGVPQNLLGCTLDNWRVNRNEDRAKLETVRQFCRKRSGFLWLTSDRESPSQFGLGKTHLAIGVMRELNCGRFLTHNEFMRRLRMGYGNERAEDVVEACRKAKLLVLDELGLSGGGRDEQPALHAVLDHRYGAKLPTVITTNLPSNEIEGLLGARLADRLREATFRIVQLYGESFRPSLREKY